MGGTTSGVAGGFVWPVGVATERPEPYPQGWALSPAGRAYYAALRARNDANGTPGAGFVGHHGNNRATGGAGRAPSRATASSGTKTRRRPTPDPVERSARSAKDETGDAVSVEDEKEAQLVTLEAMIRIGHMILPKELHISRGEARAQSEAILALCEEYGLPVSKRMLLWGALATATVGIYPPRLAELGRRKRAEREARQREAAGMGPNDGPPNQPWADGAAPQPGPIAASGDEVVILTGAPDAPMRFN